MIDFARIPALWLLVFVPLLAAWMVGGWLRRSSNWRALGQSGRLRGDGAAGWLLAILCLVLALAQPRWGRGPGPPLPPGHDVVVLVDTSRSMGAEDAVPNRLSVATLAASGLIEALGQEPGNRVAVVAFSGRGRRRCPLTENLGAAVETLEALRPGDIQPGGTNLGAGIEAALEAFDSQDHADGRTIVLFSDGEDHARIWESYVDLLHDSGIVLHTVAIGDATRGHLVPAADGTHPLTYQGETVESRRNDAALKSLATATGGAFIPLGLASADLGALYRTRIAPVAKQKRESIHPSEKTERFPLFVAAAVFFGLWASRPRPGRWLGSRRWLFFCVVFALGGASGTRTPGERVADGRSAYAAGRLDEALACFQEAIALDPNSAVPRYNAASTLFRMERFQEAQLRYQEAWQKADAKLRTKIDFSLGNTALALGDVPAALKHYDDCLASTARGSRLDAVREDAAVNRRFAEQQSRNATPPPAGEGPDPSRSDRTRDPDQPGNDHEGSPETKGADGSSPGQGENPSGLPTTERRGPGGAGGTGPAPPRAGSPEARLATALENIREARSRRLDEVPPLPDHSGEKDW